jgi:hypothetical protein
MYFMHSNVVGEDAPEFPGRVGEVVPQPVINWRALLAPETVPCTIRIASSA